MKNKVYKLIIAATVATLGAQLADASTINWPGNSAGGLTTAQVYDNTDPDPTTLSSSQYGIGSGGSLTINSGTLTVNNTTWGAFVGQNSLGSITNNGGNFTWNAVGGNEQRMAIGNGPSNGGGTGYYVQNAGSSFFHTGVGSDTQRGFIVGRDGGNGFLYINGGSFTSDCDRFGMGGAYNSSGAWVSSANANGIVTFGLGNGVLTFNGLTDLTTASWNLGVGSSLSYFNWLSGSGGSLAIGTGTPGSESPASQSFFESMVASGGIRVDGVAALASQFTYSVNANNEGVYQLAVVPEPTAAALAGLGLLLGAMTVRRQRA